MMYWIFGGALLAAIFCMVVPHLATLHKSKLEKRIAHVVGIFGAMLFLGGTAFVWGPPFYREYQSRKLMLTGKSAQARILKITDTGNRYNHTPEIRLDIEVQPTDQPPYQAEIIMVQTMSIIRFQPGSLIQVKYDPQNPQNVSLIFE